MRVGRMGIIAGFMVLTGCTLDEQAVYFPARWQQADWAVQSGLPLEEVWLTAADGTKLYGWFVEAAGSPAVLLWCHGNAGNIIHRLDNIGELHRRGISVLIFDYRGYGLSEGRPSESGLYQDALAAYDWLVSQRRIPPERIVVFGRSLGAAVAGELATKRQAAGLILETPFPSVRAVARAHYGWFPAHWFVRARYDLASRLPKLTLPILVLHGDRDEVIPLELGRQVYAQAPDPKDFYVIAGATHNDTYVIGGEAYFQRLIAFLRQVTSASSGTTIETR